MPRRKSTPNQGLLSKKGAIAITSFKRGTVQSPSWNSPRSKTLSGKNVSNQSLSGIGNESRRKNRVKPGTRALRDIRHLQRSVNQLIPKAPLSRVVREIFQMLGHGDKRIQHDALEALHEAVEMYVIQVFQDAVLCCYHAKRVTLKPVDIQLVRRLRGVSEIGNL